MKKYFQTAVAFILLSAASYSYADFGTGGVVPKQIICMNQPIPSGYIINQIMYQVKCGTQNPSTNNAYVIAEPNEIGGSQICRISPIPEGYVIKQVKGVSSCGYSKPEPFTKDNAFVIYKAVNNIENVCMTSPIPSNYEIIGVVTLSQCTPTTPSARNNAYSLRKK